MNHLAAILLTLVVVPFAAWADPPGRVGRLAWIEGEVSVYADPEQGWERAGINTHLTGENSVWTQPGARAEVRIGSLALRLDEATQLDISRLDDDTLNAHVVRGSLAVRVRNAEKGDTILITTPGARFQIRGNGRYRVDADSEGGESRLSVFSGNARLEVAGGYVHVETGRSIRVSGSARPSYGIEPAQESAIDEWAMAREARYSDGQAARYVSPRMTGWEELDAYGEWRQEPDYGAVWYPSRVDPDWAPYRYGRWMWVRPWGWSWVDEAPWGYAPFHYGRWVFVANRWGWYPGRYTQRPIWAPALVGWVGQPGWSVSVSGGPLSVVGWYPLSPFDRYEPWYSANTVYVNNINTVVIVNRQPPRHYENRDRGATVVARDHFGSHRPVQSGITRVPRDVIAAQPIVRGSTALPSREEWRARPGNREAPPTRIAPRAPAAGTSESSSRPSAPPVGPSGIRPPSAPSAMPGYPVERPKPVPPEARERPSAPRYEPQAVQPRPVEPRSAEPRGGEVRAPRVVEKPVAPSAPPAQPGAQPGARTAEKPPQAQAGARPADKPPQAQAAPAKGQDKPASAAQDKPSAKGGEKPAKAAD